ncbi:MAG: BlaI/MecI/CopY family transcriptional regulator [Gammaproteobacteria bacterium]|nr:BlaI/MecI/CopY family transcriptional regulator [Gammaproteobacteria bacterium]
MTKKTGIKPTDAELLIMQALWQHKHLTVHEVLETVGSNRNWGYTTVLKLMQIMTKKELVGRDTSKQTHVYWAKVSQQETRKGILNHVIDGVFGRSSGNLVLQALNERKVSQQELAEIKKLIDQLEDEGDSS